METIFEYLTYNDLWSIAYRVAVWVIGGTIAGFFLWKNFKTEKTV